MHISAYLVFPLCWSHSCDMFWYLQTEVDPVETDRRCWQLLVFGDPTNTMIIHPVNQPYTQSKSQ